MNYQNSTTNLMDPSTFRFQFPDMVDSGFSQEELAEDMEGLQLSFQRIKIPGGGVPQFEMPSDNPDNPEYVNELLGVVLYHHASNAYWQEGSEYNDDTPPLCQSMDGNVGYGQPGGLCSSCGFNCFGSDSKGSGKACKNQRILYLLLNGAAMPVQLSLPPTSLRPFNDFVNSAFMMRRRPLYGSVIRIRLKRVDRNGFTYSVAVFNRVHDFTGVELAKVRAYAASFREQIKFTLSQRADAHEAASGAGVEVSGTAAPGRTRAIPDNEGHFFVGVIDGEREKLPA